MNSVFLELSIIFALLVANGVFAMAEIAIVSSRKARLRQLATDGDVRARLALELAASPNTFLATVQIGITLVGVLAAAFSGASISAKLAVLLQEVAWLSVKIFSKLGDPFNAYLVQFGPPRTSQKGHELPLIPAFTAERVHKYFRSARVEVGEYHLSLINSAPPGGMHEPSLSIYCRLDP